MDDLETMIEKIVGNGETKQQDEDKEANSESPSRH